MRPLQKCSTVSGNWHSRTQSHHMNAQCQHSQVASRITNILDNTQLHGAFHDNDVVSLPQHRRKRICHPSKLHKKGLEFGVRGCKRCCDLFRTIQTLFEGSRSCTLQARRICNKELSGNFKRIARNHTARTSCDQGMPQILSHCFQGKDRKEDND